jgi:hypothetical protein
MGLSTQSQVCSFNGKPQATVFSFNGKPQATVFAHARRRLRLAVKRVMPRIV